jgi:hypothetical protein
MATSNHARISTALTDVTLAIPRLRKGSYLPFVPGATPPVSSAGLPPGDRP